MHAAGPECYASSIHILAKLGITLVCHHNYETLTGTQGSQSASDHPDSTVLLKLVGNYCA